MCIRDRLLELELLNRNGNFYLERETELQMLATNSGSKCVFNNFYASVITCSFVILPEFANLKNIFSFNILTEFFGNSNGFFSVLISNIL